MIMELLMTAIMTVETGGEKDPCHGVGRDGLSFGRMQITDVCREDVNRICGTNFVRDDCFDLDKSKWLFRRYIGHYATKEKLGREVTDEDRARIWNGGPNGWKHSCTRGYWERVKKALAR